MIPLAVPNVGAREAALLQECVASTFVSSVGPFVNAFEAQIAEACGSAGAVATSSGTTALHAALVSVGVQRDDLVIIPTLTFIATANAVSHCGATPWLLDIDATWCLDVALLADVLRTQCVVDATGTCRHRASGARVAAIVPVHTLGLPADCEAIVALARPLGIPVVVDAAAALGALDQGRRLAEVGADLAILSFNGNKTVTAGGGGAIVGPDVALLQRARHLTTTAKVGADYTHDAIGFNYRMTNLQAAVGCAQMERVAEFVAAKQRIRARYDAAWAALPGVEAIPARVGTVSACWMSGMVLPPGGDAAAECAALRTESIDARTFWKPMHRQLPYANVPAALTGASDDIWARVVTLPCSTQLTEREQDTVIAAVARRHRA